MTITLELSREEEAALGAVAGAAGVSSEAVLRGLIAQLALPRNREAPEAVGTNMDAEADERRREQEEVEANIRRWHAERV